MTASSGPPGPRMPARFTSRTFTSMANVEKTNIPPVTDAELAEACRHSFHGNFAAAFNPRFAIGCLMG